jgi:hypothetical protein
MTFIIPPGIRPMPLRPADLRLQFCRVAVAALILFAPATARAQETFPSAEKAAQALVAAAKQGEAGFLERIFGPGAPALIRSGDDEEDRRRLADFIRLADEAIRLDARGADGRTLVLGRNEWPFPVPLVRRAQQWSFDLEAGRTELVNRSIGFNELSAIEACRAFVEAQREYAREDHDGDELREYAQRIISTAGRRDGLYWPAGDQADRSPLDSRLTEAVLAGAAKGAPYRGYRFRILRGQGADAPGGAFGYVVNGHMLAGYALVAYPAQWGRSGVMTFICNMQGRVYQRDLGPDTAARGRAMTSYNPGRGWTRVP